jgi:murein DD-endopeptidase MepM/ murein hydrolase activator NlpD
MSEFLVKKGEQVKRGQAIGLVGNTGLSVSAHLHYEVLKDYQNVNPIGFFQHELDEESYALLLELAKRETVPLD